DQHPAADHIIEHKMKSNRDQISAQNDPNASAFNLFSTMVCQRCTDQTTACGMHQIGGKHAQNGDQKSTVHKPIICHILNIFNDGKPNACPKAIQCTVDHIVKVCARNQIEQDQRF